MTRPKFAVAEPRIIERLNQAKKTVFLAAEIEKIFAEEKANDTLSRKMKFDAFIAQLSKRKHLVSVRLRSELYDKSISRYCRTNFSPFELAASLANSGYLSHGTAAHLLGLLPNAPSNIYLNVEQSEKPRRGGSLTQHGIDIAFARAQRESKLAFTHDGIVITKLSGKNTKKLGVEQILGPSSEVLRVSIPDLLDTLDKLDYVYPYAQAIGFLMQSTGYTKQQCEPLKPRVTELNFYLAHGMNEPAFDASWKLFYPRTLGRT